MSQHKISSPQGVFALNLNEQLSETISKLGGMGKKMNILKPEINLFPYLFIPPCRTKTPSSGNSTNLLQERYPGTAFSRSPREVRIWSPWKSPLHTCTEVNLTVGQQFQPETRLTKLYKHLNLQESFTQ